MYEINTLLLLPLKIYYGRPLSVSGRPCYILPMFFFLFIYLFFMAALFSGPGERAVRESFTRGGP